MNKRAPLRHEARDTNGNGESLTKLVEDLLNTTPQNSREMIRKGQVAINRRVIKDILYKLDKGSHVLLVDKKPVARITII